MTQFDSVINLVDFWRQSPRGWLSRNRKPFVDRLRHDLHLRIDPELERTLRRLEASESNLGFQEWWERFYDWADLNRIRVITR